MKTHYFAVGQLVSQALKVLLCFDIRLKHLV